MPRDRIEIASTTALEARLEQLENDAPETFPDEWFHIERELDNRYFASHDDARVRQGMGER